MDQENQGNTQNNSSIDVDSVLSSIEDSPSSTREMSAQPEPQAQQQQQNPEYEFTWNGKKIKAPIDKISQWASQGYDYGQKMAEFNRKQQEFQTYQKQVEEYKSKYEQVDQYIRENPDWWNHVQQAYQQKAQNLGADPNNIKEIAKTYAEEAIKPIQQKLAEKEQAELFAKQDQELDSQIKSVREKYSDLDFDAVSENGKTLLYEVLEFGATNNITNFDIAFKAFYHDKLINRAETRAKESYTKEIQKRTKLGLLSESSTPKRVVSDLKDVKQKSYNDITKEILDEYGIR